MVGISDFLMQRQSPSYGDPRSLSGKIQEWLGAKQTTQGGMVEGMLSQRFQPQPSDIGEAAVQTLFQKKPVSSQNISDQRNSVLVEQLANIEKLNKFDLDGMAQQAAYKASLGQPLEQNELAAVKAYSGFHPGGTYIDPATQTLVQKPSLFDSLGLNGSQSMQAPAVTGIADIDQQQTEQLLGDYQLPTTPNPGPLPPSSGLRVTGPLAGSPRAQIMEAEAGLNLQKDKIKRESEFNDSQGKAATFADRMQEADKIITPIQNEGLNIGYRNAEKLPGGNYVLSPNYQKLSQAERNFTNAVLRRESGATILPAEEENARRQYFPQPGDSQEVIKQKAQNRKIVIDGFRREAGPAYKPTAPTGTIKFLGFE